MAAFLEYLKTQDENDTVHLKLNPHDRQEDVVERRRKMRACVRL